MRTGHGLKRDRHYDWALIDVIADDDPRRPRPYHLHQVEDRRELPSREGNHRPRPGPGDLLELVDALEPDQPDSSHGPDHHPRPHTVNVTRTDLVPARQANSCRVSVRDLRFATIPVKTAT